MKLRLLTAALVSCLVFGGAALAQTQKKAPAPKSPADQAFDAFSKLRNDGNSKKPTGFQALIAAGVAYIVQHPTHGQVGRAINELAFFANNNIDPKEPALRTSFVSYLKLEVTNQRYKEGVTEPAQAALGALDAAVADSEVRLAPNPSTIAALREKLDTLAEMPGAVRFIGERERSYAHLLVLTNQAPRAEAQLKKLAGHADKGVAGMAREELNTIEVRKTPFDLKFTALDGKPVDFAQLRGKVVALYFWSSTNKGSTDGLERLRQVYSDYRKRGFEAVTVSFDKAEDREKLNKYIKETRMNLPVYFDGKQAKNDFSPKLNVYSVPRLLLFDQKGILQTTMQGTTLSTNLPVNVLEGQVRRLLGMK